MEYPGNIRLRTQCLGDVDSLKYVTGGWHRLGVGEVLIAAVATTSITTVAKRLMNSPPHQFNAADQGAPCLGQVLGDRCQWANACTTDIARLRDRSIL